MQVQIRQYTVSPGRMQEWVDYWRRVVLPLRHHFGFYVIGAWSELPDGSTVPIDVLPPVAQSLVAAGSASAPAGERFVWVVAHDQDFAEMERVYYGSQEWADMRAASPNQGLVVQARIGIFQPVTHDVAD